MNDLALNFLLFQTYYPNLALLLVWLLKSSALLVLAFGLASLLHRRSARARCWIWRLTFVAFAGLLLFEFVPGALRPIRPQVKVSLNTDAASHFITNAVSLNVIHDGQGANHVAQARQARKQNIEAIPPWDEGQNSSQMTVADFRPDFWAGLETALPQVAGIGAAALLLLVILRTALGQFILRRRSTVAPSDVISPVDLAARRLGVRGRWQVRISSGVASPILFGFLRPLILLPEAAARWDQRKLETVFVHEFAHWLRRDYLWLQFARVLLAIFWWNPFLRLALVRMKAEAEEAADDIVILDSQRADVYAQTLVEIAAGDPRSGSGIGVSMLGYRSLERRIRRVLQENRWRGKVGRLAAAVIILSVLVFAGVSSVYVAMAAPTQSAAGPLRPVLSPEMRSVAERIVAHTKERLAKLRFTHAKVESLITNETDGQTVTAPVPSRVEIWNDLWSRIHRAEYRPQVTIWTDGAAPFYVKDADDICNGRESFYFETDEPPNGIRPMPPRGPFIDYLAVVPATDLIGLLGIMVKMDAQSPPGMDYSMAYTDWKGRRAVRVDEIYTREGKALHQRSFIVLPDAKDLVVLSEITYPSSPAQGFSRWEADEVVTLPGQPESFAARFTQSSLRNAGTSRTTTAIKTLDVLSALPPDIAALPKNPEDQYIAKSGKAIQRDQLDLTCVDPTTGTPVPDVRVDVRINELPLQKLRTDAQGALALPLPKEEITYLSLKALKKGFVGRTVSWRKYGDPLQLPAAFEIKMPPGSPISGRVVDDQGRPVAGATVYMALSGGPRTWSVFGDRYAFPKVETKTNAEGQWTLPDFPSDLGGLSYRVSAPGFRASTDSGISDFLSSSGLTYASLRDGQAVFKLARGIQLTGRITDAHGQPVEKCRLTIGDDIHGTNCPVAESNAAGQYTLTGLSEGKTWITAEAPGLQPVAREITLPLTPASLDFVLPPGRTIRARVTMPDGSPCAKFNVGVDQWNNLRTLNFATQTDDDGVFVWTGAPDAPVEFNFGACQGREFLSGLWLKPSDAVQSVVMKPALQVTGQVVDARTGQPIKTFTVTPGYRIGDTPADVYWNHTSVLTFNDGAYEWKTNRLGQQWVLLFEAPGYEKFETRAFPTEQQSTQTEMVKLQPAKNP